MSFYENFEAGWQVLRDALTAGIADIRHKVVEEGVYGRQTTADPVHAFYGADHAPTFRDYCAQRGSPGAGEEPGQSVSKPRDQGQEI